MNTALARHLPKLLAYCCAACGGIGPDSWKWQVQLDEKTFKSGEAPSRAAAKNSVVWVIDKALKKKVKLKPSPDELA
jgi:hypothetical protein